MSACTCFAVQSEINVKFNAPIIYGANLIQSKVKERKVALLPPATATREGLL